MPSKFTLKDKGLNDLIKAFKTKPKIRVGVLVAKNARNESDDTSDNVKIGAIHEFGQGNMPQRSFLRMPMVMELENKLNKSGVFDEKALKDVIADKSLMPWAQKVGAVGVDTVLEAFATGGFGQWPKSNMSRKSKKNKMTLVENGYLRDSIGWDVKK